MFDYCQKEGMNHKQLKYDFSEYCICDMNVKQNYHFWMIGSICKSLKHLVRFRKKHYMLGLSCDHIKGFGIVDGWHLLSVSAMDRARP